MDLKWLEDFASLAKTHSFSRSAEERHVTQSAFSRRIRALESWLGVALIDRSTYPTTLTAQGRQFRETAEETIRMLHENRLELQASARPNRHVVSVAALHTLSFSFFPGWFRQIEHHIGPLGSRLLPDDFHHCLQAIIEGGYDFLLTFHHASVPIPLEVEHYPYVSVGSDSLMAVRSADFVLSPDGPGTWPLLTYATDSFLGRVTAFAQSRPDAPAVHVAHTNENAMSEALKFMALEGHGVAWLPRSRIARELAEGRLVQVAPEIPLEIRLYRNALRARSIVESIWKTAHAMAAMAAQTEG